MAIPTDRKLDVALAAMRGAGMTPKEIILTRRDRRDLSPMALMLASPDSDGTTYRRVPLRDGKRSYILVNLPAVGDLEAPIGPRDFARWFPILPDRPPEPLTNTRKAKVA